MASPATALPGTALPGTGTVLLSQVRYQLTLLARTPRALILALLLPGVMLSLEVTQGKQHGQAASPALVHAEVGGLIVFGTLSIAYVTYASGLIAAREEGILRRWHLTPLPAWGYFAGRIVASVLLADAAGGVLLVIAMGMAHLHLTGAMVASLLIADTAGAITLAAAGTAVTSLVTSVAGANPVLVFTYVPLLIFSGAFGYMTLPHWLTTAMSYLPVQPVIHSVTRAVAQSGGGLALITGRDLAVLGGWTLGCLALSVWSFRWDPHRPRHARRPN
jgi:ABC-2 type transport system permease protein